MQRIFNKEFSNLICIIKSYKKYLTMSQETGSPIRRQPIKLISNKQLETNNLIIDHKVNAPTIQRKIS